MGGIKATSTGPRTELERTAEKATSGGHQTAKVSPLGVGTVCEARHRSTEASSLRALPTALAVEAATVSSAESRENIRAGVLSKDPEQCETFRLMSQASSRGPALRLFEIAKAFRAQRAKQLNYERVGQGGAKSGTIEAMKATATTSRATTTSTFSLSQGCVWKCTNATRIRGWAACTY